MGFVHLGGAAAREHRQGPNAGDGPGHPDAICNRPRQQCSECVAIVDRRRWRRGVGGDKLDDTGPLKRHPAGDGCLAPERAPVPGDSWSEGSAICGIPRLWNTEIVGGSVWLLNYDESDGCGFKDGCGGL